MCRITLHMRLSYHLYFILSGKAFLFSNRCQFCDSIFNLSMFIFKHDDNAIFDKWVCLSRVVPDNPSARMMGLPTTRKIASKNRIVFGTGDHWHAPTLTANMGFVRAISQTGMSLLTIEHRPRALTGD